jgi:dTDP-4-dehydrorhamnose 3,5-epimerase
MKFTPLKLHMAYQIDFEPIEDHRGFFARSFCREEFESHGLTSRFVQHNISWNKSKGTLRGMHYQAAPHEEVKVVRCTRGALYDVMIDLRPDSETYGQWLGVELTERNRRMLYIPPGFAHGFQTLEPDTEVFYLLSEFYTPEAERAVRWDDPFFGIKWPLLDPIISERDRRHPAFNPDNG